MNRDYFRIRKPIDRRLYELARKHCGTQSKWCVITKVLYEKSGSRDAIRNFRMAVKMLAESEKFPDYRMIFNQEDDAVTFYAKAQKGAIAQIRDVLRSSQK